MHSKKNMELRVLKWPLGGGWVIQKKYYGKYWNNFEVTYGVLDSEYPVFYKTEQEALERMRCVISG